MWSLIYESWLNETMVCFNLNARIPIYPLFLYSTLYLLGTSGRNWENKWGVSQASGDFSCTWFVQQTMVKIKTGWILCTNANLPKPKCGFSSLRKIFFKKKRSIWCLLNKLLKYSTEFHKIWQTILLGLNGNRQDSTGETYPGFCLP